MAAEKKWQQIDSEWGTSKVFFIFTADARIMSTMSRSMYVSRLRRAFLLRVHPDRFRMRSEQLRNKQALLVKALANRMSESDFVNWQQQAMYRDQSKQIENAHSETYHYVLERRDGSLVSQKMSMNSSVEEILAAMAMALEKTGAAAHPKPPQIDLKRPLPLDPTQHSTSSTNIDVPYDVVSRKGRNLFQFLKSMDLQDMKQRKINRTHAQAAALGVRKLYQFQSVDATSLGWSSASVAVLLQRMESLFEEYHTKFHVKSFYPIRLIFTPDDFCEALDVFGSVLRINPGATIIQILETLQLVTPQKLDEIHSRRASLETMKQRTQNLFNVKFIKGYSCTSREYYYFLKQLMPNHEETSYKESDSFDLTLTPTCVVVEGAQTIRRPVVTSQGQIRISSTMPESMIRQGVDQLATRARQKYNDHIVEQARAKNAIQRVQWELGLQKVTRNGVVEYGDFVDGLLRLLEFDHIKISGLAGNSLGIATSGSFCHLGDDGSIVIPHDFII